MVVLIPCEIYFSPDVVLYATASIGSYTNGHRVFRPATWFSLDYTRKSNSRLAEDWEFYKCVRRKEEVAHAIETPGIGNITFGTVTILFCSRRISIHVFQGEVTNAT